MPINYDSILSTYDDKLTLMQWLRKVEEALKSDTAKEFIVTKTGNATINFSLVFEDGTALTSGDIVLQQGESVESARIENGHLILTLTNGDDLDAGNMFNGNINVNGDLSAGRIVSTIGTETPIITGISGGNVEVNTPLLIVDGDLAGSGAITADSIIENMAGYSFSVAEKSNLTKDVIYAGAVKNGNILTFAVACNYTRTGTVPTGNDYIFTIPSNVGSKLYSTNVGGSDVLATGQITFHQNVYGTPITTQYSVTKTSNTQLQIILWGLGNLELNTIYFGRVEISFLLSDSLAA